MQMSYRAPAPLSKHLWYTWTSNPANLQLLWSPWSLVWSLVWRLKTWLYKRDSDWRLYNRSASAFIWSWMGFRRREEPAWSSCYRIWIYTMNEREYIVITDTTDNVLYVIILCNFINSILSMILSLYLPWNSSPRNKCWWGLKFTAFFRFFCLSVSSSTWSFEMLNRDKNVILVMTVFAITLSFIHYCTVIELHNFQLTQLLYVNIKTTWQHLTD